MRAVSSRRAPCREACGIILPLLKCGMHSLCSCHHEHRLAWRSGIGGWQPGRAGSRSGCCCPHSASRWRQDGNVAQQPYHARADIDGGSSSAVLLVCFAALRTFRVKATAGEPSALTSAALALAGRESTVHHTAGSCGSPLLGWTRSAGLKPPVRPEGGPSLQAAGACEPHTKQESGRQASGQMPQHAAVRTTLASAAPIVVELTGTGAKPGSLRGSRRAEAASECSVDIGQMPSAGCRDGRLAPSHSLWSGQLERPTSWMR